VRSFFVVFDPPRRDLPSRIEQVLKPAHGQAFFPQPSVKTLDLCVLRRLPRLNVYQLDLPFYTPSQKMPTGQFRPIVATDRQGLSALTHNRLQDARHSSAREAGVHFQGQEAVKE